MPRNGLRLDRLGLGEWLLGLASLALLVVLFALPWFGLRSVVQYQSPTQVGVISITGHYHANGWSTFAVIGPLTLLVCVVGLAIWWFTATRRSPAVPVALMILLVPFSLALLIALIVRVLIDQPTMPLQGTGGINALEARPGAYLALALSAVVAAGIYLSFRREGVADADAPREIETLDVTGATGDA